MNTESYRFKVGEIECIAVSDGTHTYAPPDFPPPGILLPRGTGASEHEIHCATIGFGKQGDFIEKWRPSTEMCGFPLLDGNLHLLLFETSPVFPHCT